MNKKQFNKICKHCEKEIFLSINNKSYRTKEKNSFGWLNVCYDYPHSSDHEPFTNLEYLEYKLQQKESA